MLQHKMKGYKIKKSCEVCGILTKSLYRRKGKIMCNKCNRKTEHIIPYRKIEFTDDKLMKDIECRFTI